MRRVALALLVAGCRRALPDDSADAVAPPASATVEPSASAVLNVVPRARPPLPDVATDWCLEDWRGLDEASCYLVPEDAEPRLLLYLPGIVPPVPRSPQKESVQRIVAAAARRARVVAILPRGRRGIGPAEARDWWAWPTSPADHGIHAGAIVAEWKAARTKLETALGRPFERTYVAGSSSGAYFLTALALAGAFEADGWAATSGGAPGGRTGGRKCPFYVGWASGDPTNGGPKRLAAFLKESGWPVRAEEHPGGHGAREVYLDEAFAFWASR